MLCLVVRRLRLRAEATCVACIAGLRCVAAIFTSLRCRRACWRLDANVPCGRASASSFAMLVLLCPAGEKAAPHSCPDNASLACLHGRIVLYMLVFYAGVSAPSEPKDSNSSVAMTNCTTNAALALASIAHVVRMGVAWGNHTKIDDFRSVTFDVGTL